MNLLAPLDDKAGDDGEAGGGGCSGSKGGRPQVDGDDTLFSPPFADFSYLNLSLDNTHKTI